MLTFWWFGIKIPKITNFDDFGGFREPGSKGENATSLSRWPRARRYLTSWYQDGRLPGTYVPHIEPSWQAASGISRLAGVPQRGMVASRHLTSNILVPFFTENVDF